jgi:dienelactone hydrolase
MRRSLLRKILLIMCILLSFTAGWIVSYFYPLGSLPLEIKSFKRFELKRKLQFPKTDRITIKLIKEEDLKTHIRRLIQIKWNEVEYEAYLLVPKNHREKYPVILALHGHHTTKEDVVGIRRSPFGVDFGLRLVKSGFCVLAPDIPFSQDMRIEDHVALNLIMVGTSLTGLRISYLDALIDYLFSLNFIDQERIGCIGWSMGGGLAMYLAAVDIRVKAAAVSSYFGVYRDSFMKRRQSTDNYIPDILNFGEMAAVACLIAPRPLWLEGGERDPEFPQGAFMKGVERLKRCYKGHEGYLQWKIIPGGHRFQGHGIEDWFKKRL